MSALFSRAYSTISSSGMLLRRSVVTQTTRSTTSIPLRNATSSLEMLTSATTMILPSDAHHLSLSTDGVLYMRTPQLRQINFNADKILLYSWVVKTSSLGSPAERKERRKSIVSQNMGSCIRSERRELELTQKKFAEILGVAKGTVHVWGIGKMLPRRSSINRIHDCFGLGLTDITDGYFEIRSRESAQFQIELVCSG